MRGLRFIKSDFVDFLELFHLNEKYISVAPSSAGNGEIDICVKGPWLHTIMFEVPLLYGDLYAYPNGGKRYLYVDLRDLQLDGRCSWTADARLKSKGSVFNDA